jgi:hypothetical protein
VLTDLEADAGFDLSMPVPVHVAADEPGPDYNVQPDGWENSPVTCRFDLTGGSIVLYLAFGEVA